jgi:hypothetical protein
VTKRENINFIKKIKDRLNPGYVLSLASGDLFFHLLFRDREVKTQETIALYCVMK